MSADLAAIVARHRPAIDLGNGRNYCQACGLDTRGPNGWPCDTAQVLVLLRETRDALGWFGHEYEVDGRQEWHGLNCIYRKTWPMGGEDDAGCIAVRALDALLSSAKRPTGADLAAMSDADFEGFVRNEDAALPSATDSEHVHVGRWCHACVDHGVEAALTGQQEALAALAEYRASALPSPADKTGAL